MPSAKTKRHLFNALLAAIYIGVPIFAATQLYPVLISNRADVADLNKAERILGRWLHMTVIPTQTRIDTEQQYRDGMRGEYGRVIGYLRQRSSMLNRGLLDTYSGDPVHVKLKYQQLRQELEQKGRYEQARTALRKPFMPVYEWEEPARTPAREDFEVIEKKACIAEVLVGLLARSPCAIGHLAVGDPFRPTGEPTDEEAEGAAGGYVVWPVTLELLAPFRQLALVLDKVATPSANGPCVIIHNLHLEAAGREQVTVKLALSVLDFE